MLHKPQILFILLLLILSSCAEENQERTQKEQSNDQILLTDSLISIDPGGEAVNFEERFKEMEAAVTEGAYDRNKMDPADKRPFWKMAINSAFYKYLKKGPISNSYGASVYPRHIIKGWAFSEQAELEESLYGWLSKMESSADSIIPGQDVDALKSPPFICAVLPNEVFMISGSCVYSGESWDTMKENFFNHFKENALYRFEVSCEAGKLSHKK